MQSILETCQPRSDILPGSCNPEIFTASLSQVMDCYRGRATPIHNLYTDADATSYAAPGRNYFEQVLGNRTVSIFICTNDHEFVT